MSFKFFKRAAWAALFILLQAKIAQIFAILYPALSGMWPPDGASAFFVFTYWLGHIWFLAALIGLVFLPVILLLDRHFWFRVVLSGISSFLLVVLVFDAFVFSQYRFHINHVVSDLFFQGGGQIIELSWDIWATAWASLILLWAANSWWSEKLYKLRMRPQVMKSAFRLHSIYLFMLFIGHGVHAYSDAQHQSQILRLAKLFPVSEPLRAKRFFTRVGLLDAEAAGTRQKLKTERARKSDLLYPLQRLKRSAQARSPHILWIVVDSLRADMLTPDVMPNVSRLAEKSQVFLNHYSNSNSTRHGVFGLFYGIPGSYFEATLHSQTPPVFMRALNEVGYQFLVYSNAPLTKPEFDRTIFAEIADLRKHSQSETVYGRDIEITQAYLEAILKNDWSRPTFSFLFYDAPHGYSYPPDYKKPFPVESDHFSYMTLTKNSDPSLIRGIYKNSVHFVDSLIGEVLDGLKSQGLDQEMIILFTSDHGQEFNDTGLGYWGHNSNYSRFQTHVPMVLYWPGRTPKEFEPMSSHFDVAPTFMKELFSVANPSSDYSSGESLFIDNEIPWILMGREGDYAVFQPDQIVVVHPTGDYDVLDANYQPLDSRSMNSSMVSEAIKEMSRFIRR